MSEDYTQQIAPDMVNISNGDLEIVSQDATGDGASTLAVTFQPSANEKWLIFEVSERNIDDTATPDAIAYLTDGTDTLSLDDSITLVTGSDAIYTQKLCTLHKPFMLTRDIYLIVRIGGATKIANTKKRTVNVLLMKMAD